MEPAGEGTPGDEEGDLLDAYMDAALGGRPPAPGEFLAGREGVSPEVRARIEEIHRIAAARRPATAAEAVPAEPGLPFERLGDFRLLRALASGGMGVVYEAVQEPLGRRVALKVLRADLRSSPEARERFRREARAVARLRHPHIVSVFASGEEAGVLWIAMDLVEGRGLDAILRAAAGEGRPIPAARAARWCAGLARALEYAHGRGVVHRDVKPSNVWIADDGGPMLLDFGVAREEGAGAATLTTAFVGSVPYAAPEQLAGRKVDGRADVYGLGVTLYQCLAGELPFEGDSVDRVIHRILHEEPVPPRRRNPSVPRDLDVVAMKALEKEPAARYGTAGEFAADLEAVLEFRPVRARPPGPIRRLRAFARARPALATAAAAALLGAATLAWMAGARRAEERERIRAEAAAEVGLARTHLEAFRRGRGEAERLEREAAANRDLLVSQWMGPDRIAALDRGEEALHALRRAREEDFHAVLDHLRRAERIGAPPGDLEEVRVRLYLEKWRDADAAKDAPAAEFYRSLAEQHDPEGALTRGALGSASVAFRSEPPGAEVHLYRYRDRADVAPGEERRLVPVAAGGGAGAPGAPAPGTVVLRGGRGAGELGEGDLLLELAGRPVEGLVLVLEDGGGAAAGDRLLSVDGVAVRDAWDLDELLRGEREGGGGAERVLRFERGGSAFEVRGPGPAGLGIRCGTAREAAERGGVEAAAWSGGRRRELLLPPGLLVRASAAAPVAGGESLAGTTPLPPRSLEPGGWLAVLRLPGYEEVRIHLVVGPGVEAVETVRLLPRGTTPPGFVRVIPRESEARPFWIREHEITCGEYLEFLNDPSTPPALVPRSRQDGAHWTRGEDGRFALHPDWRPDWPVIGVSFEDAAAYAAWRTGRERPLGGRGVYALPDMAEWTRAAGNGDRFYTFGNRFRPGWMKSCFSRPRAFPEPVLRFPVDESPAGVFDMAGGAAEWVDDWYDRPRGLRRLASGCWAWADPATFRIWGGIGWYPSMAGDEAGFRLVLREEEGSR